MPHPPIATVWTRYPVFYADPSGFTWDTAARRYLDAAGKAVSDDTVRAGLGRSMEAAAETMGKLSRGLADQMLTVQQWHDGMRESLRRLHTCSTALAQGGWAQVSPAEWGHAGHVLKGQYTYLANFAQQLADGTQPMDGRFAARVLMYANAAHGTYEESVRRRETEAGMEEERRNLSLVENCDGCIAQAALGWQPIGTLDPIGSEECLTSCRCWLSYRMKPDE